MERNWLPLLLLLISAKQSLTAKPCLPSNWNYAWSKVGDVWFAQTHEKGEFYNMVKKCQNIDPGQSSIASIRSSDEQRHIVEGLPDEDWWIGGVRLGGYKWFWAEMINNKVTFTSMNYKNWYAGEPSSPEFDHCVHLQVEAMQRKWNDVNCAANRFRAICEIRCKKSGSSLP